MVATRGAAAVRRELLVGFDPVPLLASLLEQRLPGLAHVCADYTGGVPLLALKWRPAARRPGLVRPEAAPALRPVASVSEEDSALAGGRRGRSGAAEGGCDSGPLLVELDVAAALADIGMLGAGLVDVVQPL